MKKARLTIKSNERLTGNVYRMVLEGDAGEICVPGQFINIQLPGLFLRRPISVCDAFPGSLTIVYKTVGKGTDMMSGLEKGYELDCLTGLGNGYDTSVSGSSPLLIGGGVGIPPLYYLAKKLLGEGKKVKVILGFNKKEEIFLEDEFKRIGCEVIVTTIDGSYGVKGFVTTALSASDYSYFYACGPLPMLKAVCRETNTSGQLSLEERMGCGFGACMGCSVKTAGGYKRICKDGPVLRKEEIIWED